MPKTEPFERNSEAYEAWFEEHPVLYRTELEAVRSLQPQAGACGLEVGAGTGRFAAPLGISLCVEPSGAMAAKARARGLTVIPGLAEQLPLRGESFEWVLMVTLICFLDHVEGAFREAWRVLKPGGCLLLGFIDRETELGRAYEAKRAKSRFYSSAAFSSAQEVAALLERTGFRPARWRQALAPDQPDEAVQEGYGCGAFVAVKARKPGPSSAARPPQNRMPSAPSAP